MGTCKQVVLSSQRLGGSLGCFGLVFGNNIIAKPDAFSDKAYKKFMKTESTNKQYRSFINKVKEMEKRDPYTGKGGIKGALVVIKSRVKTTRDKAAGKGSQYYNNYNGKPNTDSGLKKGNPNIGL